MSNQSDHTIVRLRVPPELKKQIEESAEKNNRSQSAEMVDRLESSFSTNFFRISTFNDLSETGYTIEIDRFTFGLFKSQLSDIRLYELHINYWILSYHSLRCTINSETANKLIDLGCKFDGSSVR